MESIIVMPEDSSTAKIRAVRDYGGTIVFCQAAKREEVAEKLRDQTAASILIPSYNHEDVIAGQGTVGLEIAEDFPDCEAAIVSIGGGGLIAGVATAAKGLMPSIEIYGAEPHAADDAYRSKLVSNCSRTLCRESGQLVTNAGVPDTIADGLRTNLGSLTWPVVRDRVDEIFLSTEAETARALQFFVERTKMLIEPSAAVAVSALMSNAELLVRTRGLRKICVVLCGGNADLSRMSEVVKLAA
eukprot:Polyplicarium_translucidae@DN1560_c0_g1_i1.p1